MLSAPGKAAKNWGKVSQSQRGAGAETARQTGDAGLEGGVRPLELRLPQPEETEMNEATSTVCVRACVRVFIRL